MSLNEGMSPLMILQKMQESSEAMLRIGVNVKRRRGSGRVRVLAVVSLKKDEVVGLRRDVRAAVRDINERTLEFQIPMRGTCKQMMSFAGRQ